MALFTSQQPVILAEGRNKRNIAQFRIKLDNNTIPLPVNVNFQTVFQIFFAFFYVFNAQYSYNIDHFMEFFEVYVFKIKHSTNSLRLKEIVTCLTQKGVDFH